MSYAVIGVAAFQLISGSQQAEQVRSQGRLSKEIADMNAEFAEVDAYNAEVDGETAAARYETQIQKVEGEQKAAYAAADVDINFGTATDVVKDSKLAGFLNILDIKNQAHSKALGYKDQARQFVLSGSAQNAQAGMNAGAMQAASVMGAAQTGLSGYSKNKYGKTSKSADPIVWSDNGTGYSTSSEIV